MTAPVKQRRSRFSTEAMLDEHGDPIIVHPKDLTDYDIRALSTLASRRVLNAQYIAKLINGYPKHILDRFSLLKAQPNLYVRVAAEQTNNPKQHLRSKLYFELAEAGVAALSERGINVPKREPFKLLKHQAMIDEIMASWQIGLNSRKQLTAMWWSDLIEYGKIPQATLDSGRPHQIPVQFRFNGEKVEKAYVADDRPFGIFREDRRGYFFPGIEADCDSESVRSNNYTYNSIKRKVAQQIAILEQEVHRSRFGFPNIFFPYYVPTPRRKESIMELVEEMTAERPSLRKSFVFAVHPTFTNYDQPEPSGWALLKDYQRVGYEPINFSK